MEYSSDVQARRTNGRRRAGLLYGLARSVILAIHPPTAERCPTCMAPMCPGCRRCDPSCPIMV